MQFTKSTDIRAKDAVFVNVENGGITAVTKGFLCAWDLTDNAAVSGIEQNTRGKRVTIYPTAEAGDVADGQVRAAGFAHTDFDATAANTRGIPYLMQVYGFRDDITANTDAGTNILLGGIIVPAGDQAGTVDGPTDPVAPTASEMTKALGMSFNTVAINTTTTIQAFIRLM